MKKKQYKILVLSDMKGTEETIMRSTVSLAKMIHAEIDFFHVEKPTDIVGQDNPLSAKRLINKSHFATRKKLSTLINSLSTSHDLVINYSFSVGHIKSEMARFIDQSKPDIIVLGKRKFKWFKFVGDDITSFIMKKHRGAIMIAANNNVIEHDKALSLGVLNEDTNRLNLEFAQHLMNYTQEPLSSFQIVAGASAMQNTLSFHGKKAINYVFQENDGAIDNLAKYLSKKNVNLLCVNRKRYHSKSLISDVKHLVNKLNVSLLITGEERLAIQ
ncbi:universal stress protein [Tamlana fucoidanivorans]|uniref:Universal stress protein n=1 Tax=Allotamlana fucoidanivorans TaxID=2583814 RepID=A0A5C4SRZ7_9FLAO|nr:universal stress protein [Tamlana fucoidanivorans]TNJ47204.1 universal stress protein [Tamlana fucoidanivorans]